MTLRHPQLPFLLAPPDDPEGGALVIAEAEILGAGWPVPIVAGVPDFVSFAPATERLLTYRIPLTAKPAPEVLTAPLPRLDLPAWFQEDSRVFDLLAAHAKGLFLDIGAGPGNRATYEKLGYDYLASDISFNSQQRAERAAAADIDLVADAHRLPLKSNCAEAVLSTAMLEHVYCPALVVREAWRVLKPGGLFFGNCSFLEAEHFDSQIHHTHLGLYRLLDAAGFEVRHLFPGMSLWEMHSGSLYFSLPGNKWLGQLHAWLYLKLTDWRGSETGFSRLLRHAAILWWIAYKPPRPPQA